MPRRLNPGAPEFSPSSALIFSLPPCAAFNVDYLPPPSSPTLLFAQHSSFYELPRYYHLHSLSPPLPPFEKPHRQAASGYTWEAKKPSRGSRLKGRNEKGRLGFLTRDDSIRKVITPHETVPLAREDSKTTVMIKNIPYDCARTELISVIDSFCVTQNSKESDLGVVCGYDFVYLPIDFRTRKSRGFAFVNFTNTLSAWNFFQAFHSKEWSCLPVRDNWHKKIEVVSAKVQGKEALVKHFSESIFDCESDEFLPVSFTPARDGTGQKTSVALVGNRRGGFPGKRAANHNP